MEEEKREKSVQVLNHTQPQLFIELFIFTTPMASFSLIFIFRGRIDS